MTRALLAAILAQLALCAPISAAVSRCVVCHATLGDTHQAILRDFEADIHREHGLSCHSCHGGDPTSDDAGEAMSPAAGFVGTPPKTEVPRFCGKCHSDPAVMKKYNPSLPVDQELKYYTSLHGRRLKAGDANVATCVACHTAHSIRPAKDPISSVYSKNVPRTCGHCHSDKKLMARYKLPADQLEKYAKSVHGKALLEKGDSAAPACNTCHGNHGAVPPGIENIGHVCGMCHASNEEFFKASPMAKAWEHRKFHICATCHGHHDVGHPTTAMLAPDNGVCRKCHIQSSAAFKARDAMKGKLDEIEAAYLETSGAIAQAEEKGMDMAEARDALDEARMSMYQARTAVHTFRAERIAEVADKGLAAAGKAKQSALDAISEFSHRRVGLGVATLLMTLLVVLLYLKTRDMERPPSK